MSDQIIRAALRSAVAAWAGAQTPPIPVAFENADNFVTPPDGARYVRVYVLPVPTTSGSLDMKHRSFQGVFQVTLCMPKGEGEGPALALHESLSQALRPDAPIVRDGVTVYLSPLSLGNGDVEDDCYSVPLSTAYRAETYPS